MALLVREVFRMAAPKSEPYEVRMTIACSSSFPAGEFEVELGRYKLEAVPTGDGTACQAVLRFSSAFESERGGGSNPEEEAHIVRRLIGLLLNTRTRATGFWTPFPRILGPDAHLSYPELEGPFDTSQLASDLERVLALTDDLARQFIRAANAYTFALQFIPSDPTFAFFLLVVSVECLSSQSEVIPHTELEPEGNTCERFCRFIIDYLPGSLKQKDEEDPELFRELLKTVYYAHRSGFVHGGREASPAALHADVAKSSYFKHATDGPEVKTPGLSWTARVIRGALLGFLREKQYAWGCPDKDRFSRLAMEKALLKVRVKRSVERGEPVTFADIDFRDDE